MSDQTENPRRSDIVLDTKHLLEREIAENGYVYVGPNAERRFKMNRHRFNVIVAWLKEDGYARHYLELEDPTVEDEMVIVKVLAGKGVSHNQAWADRDKILRLWANAQ